MNSLHHRLGGRSRDHGSGSRCQRIRDVACCYNAWTFGGDRKTLRAFDFHSGATLEVQNDVGDIFTYASNAGKFVQNVVDLYGCDRAPCSETSERDAGRCPLSDQNHAQAVQQQQLPDAQDRCPALLPIVCGLINSAQFLWIICPSIPVLPHVRKAKRPRFQKMRMGPCETREPQP